MNTNSTAAGLTRLWERTYPDDPFDEFAFDDRLLYLLCNSSLRVLDAADGHEVRSKGVSWAPMRCRPRFWGEYIFVPRYSQGVLRLKKDLSEELELWPGAGTCSVAVSSDWLYCSTWDANRDCLAKVSPVDGTIAWGKRIGGGHACSATIVDGIVYAGFVDGIVGAFYADSGQPKWQRPGLTRISDTGICRVENGVVFIPADVQQSGAPLERVYALYAETGVVKWFRPLDSSPHTYLTLLDDYVYCGSANTLHGFHRESGVPLSPLAIDPQITCPRRPRGLGLPFVAYPSSIIPYNNLLFVGAGQFVIAVDPGTLTEVARYQMEGGEVLRFLIVGSILYVGTGNYDDMCSRLTAYALPS